MSRSAKAESLRRARPLLGTLVEIRVEGSAPVTLQEALQAAFEEIEACQRCMSVHSEESDLARIRKADRGERLTLDLRTAAVLSRAAHWHAVSGGVFDVACAVPLAAHGFLPPEAGMQAAAQTLPWTACLEWMDVHSVRMHAPVHLDLGGIAKGYAVDRACEVLMRCGVEAGCVNAGGDLRVFGRTELIHLRHPAHPGCLIPLGRLEDGACATSAPYFAQDHRVGAKPGREAGLGQRATPLYDPRSAHLLPDHPSVSVLGPNAMDCDALTKIVILMGRQAVPLLEGVQAQAFQLSATGQCIALGAESADTALFPPPQTSPLSADGSPGNHASG